MFKNLSVFLLTFVLTLNCSAGEVLKEFWIEEIKTLIPTKFCESGSYFRQCFDVSEAKCIEQATLSTNVCIEKIDSLIPHTILQPQEGKKWGSEIGRCSGRTYELSLDSIKKKSANCSNENKSSET